ncbi:MAG: hypothetical protein IJ333_02050 [Clostridia bacterium]|nr:hypothetical protein [Clostridia bacterium]
MKNIHEAVKEGLSERAEYRMLQARQKNPEWAQSEEEYGAFLDQLKIWLKPEHRKMMLRFEETINTIKGYEYDFLYWQGVLDGVELLKELHLLSEK